jgi:hypothetical protein
MTSTTSKYKVIKNSFSLNGLLYREADPEDARKLAELYNKVYSGGYPIRECLEEKLVRKIIENREHIWGIAQDRDRIVGATVGRPEIWNRSFEGCRSVTDQDYGRRGIGKNLYRLILMSSFFKEGCDIGFGFPRTEGMKQLMEKAIPPIEIAGFDGGMHLVSGIRENHLMSFLVNPFRNIERIVSEIDLPSFREIVCQNNVEYEIGDYPQEVIVGPKKDQKLETPHGEVSYFYFGPSRCVQITQVKTDYEEDISRAIEFFVKEKDADHFSLYVLADKLKMISDLIKSERSFSINAFIPAWYYKQGKRFDCFYLSHLKDDSEPRTYGTDEIITTCKERFSKLEMDLRDL